MAEVFGPWGWQPLPEMEELPGYGTEIAMEIHNLEDGKPAGIVGFCIREEEARLMAAAPDLLAALESLVADFDASVITTDPMLIEARSAIAKARGQEIPAC